MPAIDGGEPVRGPDRIRCAFLAALLALAGCRGATPTRGGSAAPTAPGPGSPAPAAAEGAPAPEERGTVTVGVLGAGAGRADRAIRRFAGDHAGRLPTSLTALLNEPDLDGAPYLRELPRDDWGRPLSYAALSFRFGAYELRSFGPDGAPATGDDLVAHPEPVPFD